MLSRLPVRLAGPLLIAALSATPVAQAASPAPPVAEIAEIDGLDPDVLRFATHAYASLRDAGRVARPRLTILDYRRPSTDKRMWVLDMETGAVLFHDLVAHGKGSGAQNADRFGNDAGSNRTSLGVFLTAETYSGKHGYSLRLDGLEPGVNDRARDRAIVIHPADYVTPAFAARVGRLGRSHGCPAVNPAISAALIDAISGGSVVVAYGDDDGWLARSTFAPPRGTVAAPATALGVPAP